MITEISPEEFMKNPLKFPNLKYRQREKIEERCSQIVQGIIKQKIEELQQKVSETFNKMWEIGKVLVENNFKRTEEDDNIQYLCSNLNSRGVDIPTSTLRTYALFYKKYPDLSKRIDKTGLSPSHYQLLSSFNLNDEERQKLEDEASEKKWSVRELKRQIKRKDDIIKEVGFETEEDWLCCYNIDEDDVSIANSLKNKINERIFDKLRVLTYDEKTLLMELIFSEEELK